jgi:hypothetical protein
MVYAEDIVMLELNERTAEAKFHRIVTTCRDFGLSITLDTYVVMKLSPTKGSTEKIKW